MKDLFNRSFSARDRLKRAEAYSGARRALKRPKVSSWSRWWNAGKFATRTQTTSKKKDYLVKHSKARHHCPPPPHKTFGHRKDDTWPPKCKLEMYLPLNSLITLSISD